MSEHRSPARQPIPARTLGALAAVSGIALTGCGPNHHLAEHDFREASVAMVAVPAPSMEFFSDLDLRVDPTDILGTAIRVGTGIAREVSLDDFRPRADSAAARVNIPQRTADRTLDGALRYLRGVPAIPGARSDYEFELRIETWGFVADGWDTQVYLRLEGDLLLLDGQSGGIVWRTHVNAVNPMRSSAIRTNSRSVGNVVNAIALANMSREEIEEEMRVLADIAADAMIDRLARDLDDAREGG